MKQGISNSHNPFRRSALFTIYDLNTGFSADDSVARAIKKGRGMFFYLKRSIATLTPSIFLLLHKAFIRPHLEYAIQAHSPHSLSGLPVPLPRSSPLTHPPILPPEFVLPCRIPPLCYYCNYSWSSEVDLTAHLTNKRDLIFLQIVGL